MTMMAAAITNQAPVPKGFIPLPPGALRETWLDQPGHADRGSLGEWWARQDLNLHPACGLLST